MDDQDSGAPAPKKPYGQNKKRLLITYLVVAVIVYFVIYWFWIRDSGSSGSGLY